jgi:hypothetical protein
MNRKTQAAMHTLGLVPTTTPDADADEPKPVTSFDGGARRDQPAPPVTHAEWLSAVLTGQPVWPPTPGQ